MNSALRETGGLCKSRLYGISPRSESLSLLNLCWGTQMYNSQNGCAISASMMRETDGEENKSPGVRQRAFCSDSFDPLCKEGLYTGPGHPFG